MSALALGLGVNTLSASPSAILSYYNGGPDAPARPVITAGNATIVVTFTAPADNGLPITGYAVTCVSTNGGTTGSKTAGSSPVTVVGVSNARTYTCDVTATNGAGTSAPSPVSKAVIVGVPAAPTVTNVLGGAAALTVSFLANTNNGSAITSYTVSCVSSHGSAPGAASAATSPITVTGLTDGMSYTCLVTATNARGVSPPAKAGPVVVAAPSRNLASCSGDRGTLRVSPGLLLSVNKQHTFTLTAVLGKCSGPYVRAARVSVSFRSKRPVSCDNAIGVPDVGSGTLTWTAPVGMGDSRAKIQLVIASTAGHTATAHLDGAVTSAGNLFAHAQLAGTVKLDQGIGRGGDCASATRLDTFRVAAITITITITLS